MFKQHSAPIWLVGVLLIVMCSAAYGQTVANETSNIEERGLKDSIKNIAQSVKAIPTLGKLMRSVNMTEVARASSKVAKELSKSLRMDVFAAGKALAAAGAALGSVVFLGGMAGLLATGLGMFRYSPELYESNYFTNRIGAAYPNIPYLSDAQALIYQKVQQAQQNYANAVHGGAAQRARPGVVVNGPLPIQQGPPSQSEYYGERNGQKGRNDDDAFEPVFSARDARILKDTKKPFSDDLLPALQDLFAVISNNVEKAAPEVAKALRRR